MDALRLARAMTEKLAIVQIQRGGGKGVLALSRELDQPAREALLRRYGRLVDQFEWRVHDRHRPRHHSERSADRGGADPACARLFPRQTLLR